MLSLQTPVQTPVVSPQDLPGLDPDLLWQYIENANAAILALTRAVDAVEAHLMSINYTPPGETATGDPV